MEAPERTVVVGRSPDADVTLADPSLAPRHAEIVVTSAGRLHLTDCATSTGTWIERPEGGWQRLRQGFVRPESRVRLGDYVCLARELASRALGPRPGPAGPGGGTAPHEPVRRGRIERDPATGEIVRRRL
jgi:hypothetical protein